MKSDNIAQYQQQASKSKQITALSNQIEQHQTTSSKIIEHQIKPIENKERQSINQPRIIKIRQNQTT